MAKRKRGGRREAFGHGLEVFARRNGGSKMLISFKDGMRRPADPVQAAKLSTECGIHIRSKMPLATHWKEYYDSKSGLTHVIHEAISFVAVSRHTLLLISWQNLNYFSLTIRNFLHVFAGKI